MKAHPWGVRIIGMKDERGKPTVFVEYLPWCECGWMGYLVGNEGKAAAIAYRHATGRDPEPPPVRAPKPRVLQSETIFDPDRYRKHGPTAKERRAG